MNIGMFIIPQWGQSSVLAAAYWEEIQTNKLYIFENM